ncbi:PREDICTED: zinc finger protein 692 isoform X5 [Chinchilla lanigera]|uniref:zinc finger protein 692 isoform X5 n=1 Tax=Chinchilla lanigera TaxID=34839 RepID=UPI000696F2C6|nr:PREDICTED: zinc finger protein 692 isoform X5 [Chinchilla lanigera]
MASGPAEEEAAAARGRRERRRRLDARRSKCRIRLGGRMERWCRLKERLGFALHSQLATFLLDRYLSSSCTFCAGQELERDGATLEARLPSGEPDVPRPPTAPAACTSEDGDTAAVPTSPAELSPAASPPHPKAPPTSEAEVQPDPGGTPQAEPLARYRQTLRWSTGVLGPALRPGPLPRLCPYSPGSQALSTPALAWDEDTAQIGPKRIRRAAKRELTPCDFPGCGRVFSNRQYLNHHKKYQHIHQKSFCCPEPACGKSFNFKKHLKEHVKLHSDTRDYICEFCARSFRTSSNLVIHRRIHTGEKPLQCEICGFTCRQKASLNWHRRRHAETAAALRFPCEFCGKRFEKPDSVAAHRSKSHPAPQASLGTSEPCVAVPASEVLASPEGSRPLPAPQAPASLPQQ